MVSKIKIRYKSKTNKELSMKKKVLILVSSKPDNVYSGNWLGLINPLKKILTNCDLQIAALEELLIITSNNHNKNNVFIVSSDNNITSLKKFDLVIFRTIGQNIEIAVAVSNYLKSVGIRHIDTYIGDVDRGKLSSASFRALMGSSIPDTAFVGSQNQDNFIKLLKASGLGFPIILKDNFGRKGRYNYLVNDIDGLKDKLEDNKHISFVIQQYIKSDRDYRVLVFNNKIRLMIERKSNSKSHTNNTSQGGVATIVNSGIIPDYVEKDILRQVNAEGLQVAGVDIIFDQEGNYYILEINRAPQISTGAYVDNKIKEYANMIEELLL